MVEDHGVDGKAGSRRRQAVVSELGGKDRLEGRVVGESVEDLADGAVGVSSRSTVSKASVKSPRISERTRRALL